MEDDTSHSCAICQLCWDLFKWPMEERVGTFPWQGSEEGLVEVGWQWELACRCSQRPCFDGWPGSLCCTDHPAVAEVLKHVPVNSALGSELRREQSPGNGPSVAVVGVERSAAKLSACPQPFSGSRGNVLGILAKEAREGRRAFHKSATFTHIFLHTWPSNLNLKNT